jgi:hypothetical protein
VKIFLFILIFFSTLSWGLTFKNGEQTDKNDISKNIDSSNILFKINAGLADNDTTINIPGKAEFPKHIHSIYQELIKDINYSLLEVVTNDTRFGNTSLKFKLGKKCIGDRDDCERTEKSYSRVEFKQVDEDYSKNPDNVWTSFSFKIANDPDKWSKDQVIFQQWQTQESIFNSIFQSKIQKNEGFLFVNSTSEGHQIFKNINTDCAGGADGRGSKYCVKRKKEFLLMDWKELKNEEWVDVVHNINFNSDPDKGYFKVWVNGKLILDEIGKTHWDTYPELNSRDNRWIYKFGLYTPGIGSEHELLLDEIQVSRSCKKLKLERMNYKCSDLTSQTTSKSEPYNDFREYENYSTLDEYDSSKYTSLKSKEKFIDGAYKLKWFWVELDDSKKITRNALLGSDEVFIKDGNLTFTKFSPLIYQIDESNREAIKFVIKDDLILIEGRLDLDSDRETNPVFAVGSPRKNENGNYYAEGIWGSYEDRSENIGLLFEPID